MKIRRTKLIILAFIPISAFIALTLVYPDINPAISFLVGMILNPVLVGLLIADRVK